MSWLSIFENLKLSGKFWKGISPYVSGFFLFFLIILIVLTFVMGIKSNLMSGFTLFTYFPYWLRFVLLDLIASALIAIPFGVVVGFFISIANGDFYSMYYSELRSELKIKCIECGNEITPQGDWISGEIDIRCEICDALMRLIIEEGRFKKLVLKEGTKYSRSTLKTLKR